MIEPEQPENRGSTNSLTREVATFRFLWFTGVWPATFRALRHRNFQLFWYGQLISLLGTWLQNAAQSWLIPSLARQLYGPARVSLVVGLVSALGSSPMFLFSLFAGVMADRLDKRRILIVTQICLMMLAFGLALLISTGLVQLWHVALFAMFSGTVMAFDMPTRQSFVKEMVGPDDLLNAIALNSSIFNMARIVGPVVAGLLIAAPSIGMAGAFYLNGLSFIAVIIGLILIRTKPMHALTTTASVWEHLIEGLRYVKRQPVIRLILVLMAIYSVFGFSYIVLMPVIAQQVLKVGVREYTFMVSSTGLGALIGALLLASYAGQIGKGRILLYGGICFSLALIAFGLSKNLWLSIAVLPFVGAGLIVASASINSLIQEITPNELRGRVVSIWTFIFAGFTPIGALYAGSVAHLTSPGFSILIGASICLAAAIYTIVRTPWLWQIE